jgi:SAM-dependent methyltransferase
MAHAWVELSPANAEQARAWDGDGGRFWAEHADNFDASVRGYHRVFIEAARLQRYDDVLDVGCGTGQTSRDCAQLAAGGTVLGVDLSGPMLEVARQRAAEWQLTNIVHLQADAQAYPFERHSVDVIMSRNGVMFFADPVAAFSNLANALRPEGRMVLLVWQGPERNEWMRCIRAAASLGGELPTPQPDAPGPFALSRPDRLRGLLTRAGFSEPHLQDLSEPIYFGETVEQATDFTLGQVAWMLEDREPSARGQVRDALAATMSEHLSDQGVTFESAMWLVTAGVADNVVEPRLPSQAGPRDETPPPIPHQR